MGGHRYKRGGGSYYKGRKKTGRHYTKSSRGYQIQTNIIWDLFLILAIVFGMVYYFK